MTNSAPASGLLRKMVVGVALVVLVALAGLYLWQVNTVRTATPRSRIAVDIGAMHLLVPATLIRNAERRIDGPAARLDLAMRWPDFEPLASPVAPTESPSRQPAVFIAIEAADAGLDPAQRPKELYARFLAAEVETGPGTLLRRRFKPSSPYGGELLEIAPPDGEIFAARCLVGETVETDAARCLWQFRYRSLDVQVRFPPEALPQWERLNDQVRQLVQRIDREG